MSQDVQSVDASGVGLRYLELALRFGRLAPGLVEGYCGPADLAARVDREPAPTAGGLRALTAELRADVDAAVAEADRRAWLSAQLRGMDAALAYLDGKPAGYRELVRRCHGVAPQLVPEEQFAAAHRKLDEVLAGHGDVRERYRRWASTQLVSPRLLLPGLRTIADELQRRTRERFGLPMGEEIIFELVHGKPWRGNAQYLGNLRTRVQINQDLPIRSFRLLELVAHEAYPGHHTERARKDADLIQARGRVELSIYAYPTPQALLAEGIAELALEALLGDQADRIAADCLSPLGITYDAEMAAVHGEAATMLRPVRANIALLLDEGLSNDEAHAYARRWMLEGDEYVKTAMGSLLSRRWRPYESCYPEGYRLCKRYTRDDPRRFDRLLREQLTTADLTSPGTGGVLHGRGCDTSPASSWGHIDERKRG